jgi:glycosyltransferase involved in cell wall biosynthesis
MSPSNHEEFFRRLENLKSDSASSFSALAREVGSISAERGIQDAYNQVLRAEVVLNLRKPSLAIYDHAFQFIGGAQKYGLTMAAALQDRFDITLVANHAVSREDFAGWYGLDLSGCRIKIVKIPYFEDRKTLHLDPALVPRAVENPFHPVSRESGNYDIFVNNSMNEMVYPLSNVSLLVCHFPERRPRSYFYADRYTYVISNSRYTAEWIGKKWKLSPHGHIYPPVDMEPGAEAPKKKTILSVARFEPEGTKRQREMLEAFLRLNRLWPEVAREWTFILAGGSGPANPYLDSLKKTLEAYSGENVALKVNISAEELGRLYRESALFWHLCGVKQEDPSEVEHFGMTTVEAMENGMVPLVYDGGGLREIVDHGISGFRVKNTAELLRYSLLLFRDERLAQELGRAAREKAQAFSRSKFEARVRSLFDTILETYRSPRGYGGPGSPL